MSRNLCCGTPSIDEQLRAGPVHWPLEDNLRVGVLLCAVAVHARSSFTVVLMWMGSLALVGASQKRRHRVGIALEGGTHVLRALVCALCRGGTRRSPGRERNEGDGRLLQRRSRAPC